MESGILLGSCVEGPAELNVSTNVLFCHQATYTQKLVYQYMHINIKRPISLRDG